MVWLTRLGAWGRIRGAQEVGKGVNSMGHGCQVEKLELKSAALGFSDKRSSWENQPGLVRCGPAAFGERNKPSYESTVQNWLQGEVGSQE